MTEMLPGGKSLLHHWDQIRGVKRVWVLWVKTEAEWNLVALCASCSYSLCPDFFIFTVRVSAQLRVVCKRLTGVKYQVCSRQYILVQKSYHQSSYLPV